MIEDAKKDFIYAIDNLQINGDNRESGPQTSRSDQSSFLDAGIHIALNYLELSLYEMVITGNIAQPPASYKENIQNGNWSKEILKRTAEAKPRLANNYEDTNNEKICRFLSQI